MSSEHESKFEKYQNAAETVGMIPSVNPKDNLYQGLFVAATTLLGAAFGATLGGQLKILQYALIGLAAGGFLSGFVLMIVGLRRASLKKKAQD